MHGLHLQGHDRALGQALQTADALGVLGPVLDDLEEEFPAQVASAGRRIAVATAKSARFVAEMDNIAQTQGEAGASAELFEGMAAVYRRLSATPLAAVTPEEAAALTDLRDVLTRLRGSTDTRRRLIRRRSRRHQAAAQSASAVVRAAADAD